MIHSSYYKPHVFPVYGDVGDAEIDRLQELRATNTLNRTKIEEIGRVGNVDWRKSTPTVSVTLRQLEYGSMELFRKLANKGNTVSQINLTDFATSSVDIAGYKTDDNGTFLGTIYYPDLRVAGFGLNIGDPGALVERNFSLIGEDETILQNNNKYLIFKRSVVASGGSNVTVTLSDPTPVYDQDNSGRFLFKVVKVSAGVATLLEPGTGWSYNGAGALTINGVSATGDVILSWYSGSAYIGGSTPFVQNDTDLSSVNAEQCSIFLQSSTYVYRLQSVAVDVTFDRTDIKEIGNTKVVARGVKDTSVKVTLGRILEAWTIEEILRGKAGVSYGKIDPRNFLSNLNLVIKIYSDSTKSTFKMGYKFLNLSPTSLEGGTPINDYVTRGATLETDTGFITTVNAVL